MYECFCFNYKWWKKKNKNKKRLMWLHQTAVPPILCANRCTIDGFWLFVFIHNQSIELELQKPSMAIFVHNVCISATSNLVEEYNADEQYNLKKIIKRRLNLDNWRKLRKFSSLMLRRWKRLCTIHSLVSASLAFSSHVLTSGVSLPPVRFHRFVRPPKGKALGIGIFIDPLNSKEPF